MTPDLPTSIEAGIAPGASSALAPRREVGGVAFDSLTLAETIDHIVTQADAGHGGWVITANLDHARRARVEPEYREMLDEADLVVADGAPMIWAARLQGTPLPERVAGSSMCAPLAAAAAKRGLSIYFLGGTPGTADQAASLLAQQHPGLRIAGTHCPPMGFEDDPAEMARIREGLRAGEPSLVYVALGSPKQERLIRELKADFPSSWWLGIGISLSFLTGEVQRAPSWMQRCGLEWCHRLIQEPRRLAKRYLVHGLPFACRLGFGAVVKRLTGTAR